MAKNTKNNESARYDALAAHTYEMDGEERTEWTRIGRAFPNNKGGFNIRLHCIPAAVDGEVFIMVAKQEPKKDKAD
ncbi:hypothetical protein [Xanthomonas albilineans]|uniref:hypothetical protein n=1 Tax=Xanthomonas albilineans TaxID=29447 RepID=UPI0005F30CD7|nr:hypothetical protein [Xanthomonas albilineans]